MVVGNLARRGLVRRTRRPDDRRFITVTLTDKGRRLIGGMFPEKETGNGATAHPLRLAPAL